MNSDLYVPLRTLAQFPKVKSYFLIDTSFDDTKKSGDDDQTRKSGEGKEGYGEAEMVKTLMKVCEESAELVVDRANERVRPNFKLARNVLLLRNIPTGSEQEQVTKFLLSLITSANNDADAVKSVKGDIADTWYVEMRDDECAAELVEVIRRTCPEWGEEGSGRFITGRIKTESLLKNTTSRAPSTSPVPGGGNPTHATNPTNYYDLLGAHWQANSPSNPPFYYNRSKRPPQPHYQQSQHNALNQVAFKQPSLNQPAMGGQQQQYYQNKPTYHQPRPGHYSGVTNDSSATTYRPRPNYHNRPPTNVNHPTNNNATFEKNAEKNNNASGDKSSSHHQKSRGGGHNRRYRGPSRLNSTNPTNSNNNSKPVVVIVKDETNFPALSPSSPAPSAASSSSTTTSTSAVLKGFASIVANPDK